MPFKIRSNRWVLAGAACVVAAVAAWAATSVQRRDSASAAASALSASRPALTVTAARAARTSIPAVIEVAGAIAAWQEASVGARVSGLPVVAVNVNVGDLIKKGQVLARLDDATVRAELAQAEANLAQARANEQQAAANRDRALALKASGALSQQEILATTTLASTTHAQVAQAEAALAAARLKLQYTNLIAPDDGVISARSAALGVISSAGAEMFRFIRQDRLEWRAELNASQLDDVKPGLQVRLRLPSGEKAHGRIRQIAPSMNADTRLVIAYADLDAASGARAGMYVNGEIQKQVKEGVVVPSESVVIRDGRSYVLRLNGERARLIAVRTGRREGAFIEIVDGIAAGDPVIVRGAGFINDSDTVRVAAE
jgi:RND family efflux transporter MFP subunit